MTTTGEHVCDPYGRPHWRDPSESDFVNYDALRNLTDGELRGVVAEGGPAALIAAARAELGERCTISPREQAASDALGEKFERLHADAYNAVVALHGFWSTVYGPNEALTAAFECLDALAPTFYEEA